MMEEEFRAVLLANAALSALVSSDKIVFGDVLPGKDYPFVTCDTVSGAEGMTMAGPDGLEQKRVQVDCDARTKAQANAVGQAVVNALHGYRANNFLGIFHETTRGTREGGTNAADRPFRVSLDFMVNWRAAQ